MNLDDMPDRMAEGLLEPLQGLRHDLGKYISFEVRFLGAEADEGALRAALRADLLATRRAGEQVESASALWQRLRPAELEGDPDLSIIDAAMATLSTVDLDADLADLHLARDLARQVTQATRRLAERAQARCQPRSR